jgi:hypothetical protein
MHILNQHPREGEKLDQSSILLFGTHEIELERYRHELVGAMDWSRVSLWGNLQTYGIVHIRFDKQISANVNQKYISNPLAAAQEPRFHTESNKTVTRERGRLEDGRSAGIRRRQIPCKLRVAVVAARNSRSWWRRGTPRLAREVGRSNLLLCGLGNRANE